jgi:hypothetical protein
MHLAISALLLGQIQNPEAGLIDLVAMHLARIDSTLSYAIAQDNNHGTSEAAALFIGGTWLDCVRPDKVSSRYCLRGRKWLENRTRRLIETDGSFSQYSVNYHRVVLDTLSMVEIWRCELSLPCLSDTFYERCRVAMDWLRMFTQPETGDAPNIGANDGASGVSVLLTLAEILHTLPPLNIGVDLLFVDGEDMGKSGDPEKFGLDSGFCKTCARTEAAICHLH